MVACDVDTDKSVLRQYINGTIGFIQLEADLQEVAQGAHADVQRNRKSPGQKLL